MRDKNGKTLTREHYQILKELGIEIVMYDLTVYEDIHECGMHQPVEGKVSYGFEIYGGIKQHADFDELLLILKLLRAVKSSKDPVIRDMYEELMTMFNLIEEKYE